MKRTIYFPEIFELVGKAETKEEKIAILHRFYNEKGFTDILVLCYEPKIKWLVTRAEIENLQYDDMDIADYDLAPTTLFLEARRRLYNWTDVRQPPLKKEKVIQLIARTFSSLHHKEIELLKQMIDRNILDTGLSEELVRDAFPQLLTGEYVPPAEVKRKPGRPPGSKNKVPVVAPKRKPGRPAGAKNKKKAPVKKKAPAKKKVVKKATTTEKVGDTATATVIKATDTEKVVDKKDTVV